MYRTVVLLFVVAIHLVILAKRLPEWNNNKTIWVAAVRVEPLDPWNLSNAAHFSHDTNTLKWLVQIVELKVPNWLPYEEREPYRIGLQSLSDTLKLGNYKSEVDKIINKSNEVVTGHKVVTGYVAQ